MGGSDTGVAWSTGSRGIKNVPVQIRILAGSVLSAFLTEHPELVREIIRTQARLLQWSNHRRVEFANLPALED